MFTMHFFAQLFIILPAFLLVLSVHEAAHAGTAYLLGDTTAKRLGRLSLNPLKHIDPIGLLCLVIFRIGWAKPVIFDHRNFKRPRLYSVLTAYAGPVSNFLLTILIFVFWKFLPLHMFSRGVVLTIKQLCETTAWISVMLGTFNLLPLPPLDGSHILMVTVLRHYPRVLIWLYRYSFFILFGLFAFVPRVREDFVKIIEIIYSFLYGLVF
jgi:Zn-dependent protease